MPTRKGSLAPTPWEAWELNADFFSALTRWTLENPKTTLDGVLDSVCIAIDTNREFFEIIPDGVFPARGLIKALAHLVKLGKVVSSAKSDVQGFAREIIRWVGQIQTAFQAGQRSWVGGDFTLATWDNLTGIRDLIDEICAWATTRLLDKRWSLTGIKNKFIIEKEVMEFKARIAEARAIFHERSIVSQAWGINAILQWISRLFEQQGQIESLLNNIHSTQAKHMKHVIEMLESNEAEEARRREAEERRRYVMQILSTQAVADPSYVKQGKAPCDQDTRVDVLKEIMAWVQNTTEDSQNFLWLTGDPGCGKSAITASIAKDCKDNGYLWAQFFINRNNTDTTNPNAYFPSIARQLSLRLDSVERDLHDKLKAKPSLMDAMSPEQATNLFIDAIRVASGNSPDTPVLIVIDGLDETDRKHLKTTADIFSHLFDELVNHPNAKVFISSRTEDDIRNPFARTMKDSRVKRLHLDTAHESSVKDVTRLLKRRIAQIVLEHDLDWKIWPGDDRMNMLAKQASGLFIWAVTAAKFIQGQLESLGTECLNDVLDKLNTDGMGDINTLYGLILSFAYRERSLDEWAFESFRRLIGAIVLLHEPLCLNDISKLLNLRKSPSSLPVDLLKFVKRLRTVLVAGTGAIDGQTIPRLHKSFFEFVTSTDRIEPRFRIDSAASHRELGVQCLRQLTHAWDAAAAVRAPVLLRYAFRFWSQHLSQASETPYSVAISDKSLTLKYLEGLIRRSSNQHGTAPIFLTFSRDKSLIQASLGNRTRAWALNTGADQTPASESSRSDPHSTVNVSAKIYASSLSISEDGTHVACVSTNRSITLYHTQTTEVSQRPIHDEVQSHSTAVFTSDGSQIITGSETGYLCIWSAQTGLPVGPSFRDHIGAVTCIAVSPVQDRMVVGYEDGHLQFWNTEHGVSLGPPVKGRTSSVSIIAVSPSGAYVLSCARQNSVDLWDTQTQTVIRQLEHLSFNTMPITSVTFSPDEELIASGSLDRTIRMYERESGKQVGSPLQGHSDGVLAVDFSVDGKQLVSGSYDRTIRVWDVENRRQVGSPLRGHTNAVHSVRFTPDGSKICSASHDETIRIWTAADVLRDTFSSVLSTAFSPTGDRVLFVSQDFSVRVCDSRPWAMVIGNGKGKGKQREEDERDREKELERHRWVDLKGRTRFPDIRLVSFSDDGSRIAAISRSTLFLWEAKTGDLIACSEGGDGEVSGSLEDVTELYPTREGDGIVTKQGNKGKVLVWKEGNGTKRGTLVEISSPDQSQTQGPSSFLNNTLLPSASNDGVDRAKNGFADLHWFSPIRNDEETGLWTFVNDHIIRARKDGSMTIVPVSRVG